MSVIMPMNTTPGMFGFPHPQNPSAGLHSPRGLPRAPIPPHLQGSYSGSFYGGQSFVPAAVPQQHVKEAVQPNLQEQPQFNYAMGGIPFAQNPAPVMQHEQQQQQQQQKKKQPGAGQTSGSSTGGVGSPYPSAEPANPKPPTYRQPPRTNESWHGKDFIRQHCVPKKSVGNDLRPLSDIDDYYFETVTAPQRVYLRFRTALNTKRLVKALDKAMLENPIAASKVVMANGRRCYHCNSVDTKLTAIMVDKPVFDKVHDISYICERLSDGPSPDGALCYFFLFRTPDPRDGCILVAHFDHTLGDAACYSRLLTSWSRNYARSSGFFGIANGSDSGELPNVFCSSKDLQRGTPLPNGTTSSFSMRYFFTPAAAKKIKSSILSGANKDEGITANDILMAQAAIALGQRRRDPANNGPRDRDYAYIAVIADTRGRTQGVQRADKHWGNHATDLGVFIPWSMLVKGADVLAVTRVIRQCIKSDLQILKAGYDQYEKHRLECAKNKMMFCWNSWYRAGSEMCGAGFGGRLTEFEWLNTYHNMGAETALVNTSLAMMGHQGVAISSGVDCTGRGKSGVDKGAYMYIQMALKDEQEARLLSEMWSSAVAVKVPRV